jgi:hypothetical protein
MADFLLNPAKRYQNTLNGSQKGWCSVIDGRWYSCWLRPSFSSSSSIYHNSYLRYFINNLRMKETRVELIAGHRTCQNEDNQKRCCRQSKCLLERNSNIHGKKSNRLLELGSPLLLRREPSINQSKFAAPVMFQEEPTHLPKNSSCPLIFCSNQSPV